MTDPSSELVTRRKERRARPGLAALTLLALPVALLADNVIALARGWHSTNDTHRVLIVVCAAAIVLVLALLAVPRTRAWLGARASKLLALHASFAVAWIVAELGIALLFGQQLWFHRMAPSRSYVYRPKPEYIRGVEGTSRVAINAIGARGPELPPRADAQRILCVGGSTTLCLYLDDSETWPALVMQRLQASGRRVWVGNLGQSGYGTSDHVRFLASTSLIEDMDVVVFLVGFNDLMRAFLGVAIDAGSGVRPLWNRSWIFALLHNWHQARKEARQHRREDEEGASYRQRRVSWQRAPAIRELPDLSAALAGYRANLHAMIDYVLAAGARPVFATQPAIFHPQLSGESYDLLWLGWAPEHRRVPPELSIEGLRRFNAVTREVCAERDVGCIDLSPLDGVESLYYDDCHFTEEGGRRVAERIAAWLHGHLP